MAESRFGGETIDGRDVPEHVRQQAEAALDAAIEGENGTADLTLTGLRLAATHALVHLVKAKGTPANVRAAASRTLLELVGAIGAGRQTIDNVEQIDAASMSVRDIDAEIARLTYQRDII